MTERTVLSKILLHLVGVACVVGVGIGIGYAIGNNQTTTDTTTTTTSSCKTTKNTPLCDVSQVNLSSFEVWKREEGYWYGEYTFLGADGNPYVSKNWNYDYAHYFGFIHLQLIGNSLKQRNGMSLFIHHNRTVHVHRITIQPLDPAPVELTAMKKYFLLIRRLQIVRGIYQVRFHTVRTHWTLGPGQ